MSDDCRHIWMPPRRGGLHAKAALMGERHLRVPGGQDRHLHPVRGTRPRALLASPMVASCATPRTRSMPAGPKPSRSRPQSRRPAHGCATASVPDKPTRFVFRRKGGGPTPGYDVYLASDTGA